MFRRSLLAAPLIMAATPVRAQQWAPKQPIKILVGYAPGGTADITARLAADAIVRKYGYPIVVENKTGAGGFIALKQVAQSPPDGYTIGIGIMGQMAVGAVVPGSNIPLDLDKELVPIANLVGVPMALIVRMDAPFKTIPELVAYAKANPGKVTYASTGLGSTNQLAAEFLAFESGGLKMTHVPYRGGAPAIADVAAGNVDLFFGNVSEFLGQIRSGALRGIAFGGSAAAPALPDLPLIKQWLPDYDVSNWFGFCGPGRMPAEILAAWNGALQAALADPGTRGKMVEAGMEIMGGPVANFTNLIAADRQRWGGVIQAAGIRAS